MSSDSSIAADQSDEYHLPTEIIDEIIGHLQDDKEALKAISLSSHIFLHRARKHLFATLVLQAQNAAGKDTTVSSPPSHKLSCLIQHAPHLIPYIQALKIKGKGHSSYSEFDDAFSKTLRLFQQTLKTGIVSSALRHVLLHHIAWHQLTMDIQAAIEHLLGLQSLKIVSFYDISSLPWTIFGQISPNVKALSLASVWPKMKYEDDEWSENDIGQPRDHATKILRIEALNLGNGTLCRDSTAILAHDSICTAHLRTLVVTVTDEHFSWFRHLKLISHVSRSLEALEIDFKVIQINDSPLPMLNCRRMDTLNLKHLSVHTSYCYQRFALRDIFLWLCKSLPTLPRPHQLQNIVIWCYIGLYDINHRSIQESWPEGQKGLEWEHIDRFFAQSRFDSLREIRVVLDLESGSSTLLSAFYRSIPVLLPVLLPQLMAKGIVVLDNEKEEHWPLYRSFFERHLF